MLKALRHRLLGPDLSIVHQFMKPPYGGGNQFLLALKSQLELMGQDVAARHIGPKTTKVLFNSFNFDMDWLRTRLADRTRRGIRTIHRVDGPISAYRGKGFELDREIWRINRELADVTVFQSRFSQEKHLEIGLDFGDNTHVIINTVNPDIFFPVLEPPEPGGVDGRIRIVASSWSDNPRKGASVYRWLDQNLDFSSYEMTFVGNIQEEFKNIRTLSARPSRALAGELRQHHIYITASLHDPCSNALLEGLACGLPALYRKSGGHPEIVKGAGLGFDESEEIPELLNRLVADYHGFRNRIDSPKMADVAVQYLSLFQHDVSSSVV